MECNEYNIFERTWRSTLGWELIPDHQSGYSSIEDPVQMEERSGKKLPG